MNAVTTTHTHALKHAHGRSIINNCDLVDPICPHCLQANVATNYSGEEVTDQTSPATVIVILDLSPDVASHNQQLFMSGN